MVESGPVVGGGDARGSGSATFVLDADCGELVETVTIRRSRFVATLAPVASEQELAALLDAVRDPAANHACWGAVIGNGPQQIARCSDDGEPSGTSGPPILAALTSRAVVNAAIVVVRYFGGIKLGAGGLVRAYGGAAASVLDRAPLRRAEPVSLIRLRLPVGDAGRVEKALYAAGEVGAVDYGPAYAEYTVQVSGDGEAAFVDRLMSLTSGAAEIVEVAHRLA
ncbi:MAG: YigZ family protein [Gordonia sp. (in: high G+C Gram-positive bacteria)]|uniref:IMPACT family protein n=1 Tax=Gordonia sp. (in: high G+C Gram-positive bacteria) TaxID=84139 RepID=UPI0039E5E205